MPLTDSLPTTSWRRFKSSCVCDLASGNGDRADDLVQETLCAPWPTSTRSSPARICRAWLFTILRNLFRSTTQAAAGGEDADGSYAKNLKTQPAQSAHTGVRGVPCSARQASAGPARSVIPGGASRLFYEDAAAICGCAVGTIKSRVNRARSKLSALLYVDGAEDFGPDETVRAVIGGSGG